jgi:predicted small secreted protein
MNWASFALGFGAGIVTLVVAVIYILKKNGAGVQ